QVLPVAIKPGPVMLGLVVMSAVMSWPVVSRPVVSRPVVIQPGRPPLRPPPGGLGPAGPPTLTQPVGAGLRRRLRRMRGGQHHGPAADRQGLRLLPAFARRAVPPRSPIPS